jgi:hypothetical protein
MPSSFVAATAAVAVAPEPVAEEPLPLQPPLRPTAGRHGRTSTAALSEEYKQLLSSGDALGLLDSLGLSEADRIALAEGLTPRRSGEGRTRQDTTRRLQCN